MLTADFDFELPKAAIAQRPLPRGEARLLVLDGQGPQRHRRVRDLPERHEISARFDHDPERLVAYYMELQERYRERLMESEDALHRTSEAAT